MFRQTPEFLCWSLEYSCPVRGLEDGRNPERTERQLRAARAVSEARCTGRVFEGICANPPCGFRLDDALALYGGLAAVEAACANCPANVLARAGETRLAGCLGMTPVPGGPDFHKAVEQAIEELRLGAQVAEYFLPTVPRWYGLWSPSALSASQATIIHQILAALLVPPLALSGALADLALALDLAANRGLMLHVTLYPPGGIEGKWWRLTRHCPRCKAAWPDEAARHCAICDYQGGPAPIRKRHARGERPYFPLERLLGAEQASEFLVRYEAFRARPQSPGPQQSPPPPELPGSPPAG